MSCAGSFWKVPQYVGLPPPFLPTFCSMAVVVLLQPSLPLGYAFTCDFTTSGFLSLGSCLHRIHLRVISPHQNAQSAKQSATLYFNVVLALASTLSILTMSTCPFDARVQRRPSLSFSLVSTPNSTRLDDARCAGAQFVEQFFVERVVVRDGVVRELRL
ncbi:hypothetical protein BC936DRAFT_139385 [Jimgerdemannia flammicorona]|uniref:Uncharacterized protein n=1 Tax=Jimgerdemannia flammicorona TaxID=994334 RepID=A0A433DHQ7_9FUNG|nr:hypothetical protein BC936DRAFT_139385 [Jimgerdemannia flammicorona]